MSALVISRRALVRLRCPLVPTSRHSQFAVGRDAFPCLQLKNSLFRLQGIRPKMSRVSMGLCKRGGAFQLKFPVFSRLSGNFIARDSFAAASQHSHTKYLL